MRSILRTGRLGPAILAVIAVLGLAGAGLSAPSLELDPSPLANLPVLEGGRTKPLDTFCREALLTVADEDTVDGVDAVRVVLSMAFQPDDWRGRPLIALSLSLRKQLGLDRKQRRISYDEILANREFQKMCERIRRSRSGEGFREESRLDGRVGMLESIFAGRAFHLIPQAPDPHQPWFAPGDPEATTLHPAMVRTWKKLGERHSAGDGPGFAAAAAELAGQLSSILPGGYPPARELDLEVAYNRIRPFRIAADGYLLALGLLLAVLFPASRIPLGLGMLAALVAVGLWLGPGFFAPVWLAAAGLIAGGLTKGDRRVVPAAALILVVAWAFHTVGLATRAYLSGRAPISNMFESMVYLAWGAITFGLGFSTFHGLSHFGAASSGVAVAMLLSAEACFDPFIAPLVPVLRSYWLWLHVSVIMLGYSGLFLAIVMAHLRLLLTFGQAPGTKDPATLDMYLHRSLQVGTACLGVGIILGGIWADYSWGRYWGWDPKETWSLITFLCFAAILHGRFTGMLSGASVATGTILGVFPLLMTYYGVNFLLVGLHSYAGADQHAGATFLDKLLSVPVWLKLYTLAEILFLQAADALVVRSGLIATASIALQAAFFLLLRSRVTLWAFAAVFLQVVVYLALRRPATASAPDPVAPAPPAPPPSSGPAEPSAS